MAYEQVPVGSSAVNAPTSLSPLPPVLYRGLSVVVALGYLSFTASTALFLLIGYRLIQWRRKPKGKPTNQFIILIFNLLWADIQQSLSFLLNTQWLIDDKLTVESATCWAQGFFISNGDLASGLFCTAIGVHTFGSVLFNYQLKPIPFYSAIGLIWMFVYGCALIGIALHPHDLYVRAGAWCWIAGHFEAARLWLHYFWVFLSELAVVILYACVYAGLWSRIRSNYYTPSAATHAKQAARLMGLYPAIYVCCTLPLASARMMSMAGNQPSYTRLCFAGAMITSNGFLDVLVYALTRSISLFSNEPPPESCGLETFSIPFAGNNSGRFGTVTTIEANAGPERLLHPRTRSLFHQDSFSCESSSASRLSLNGSTEELDWPWTTDYSNVVRTETTVQVRHEPLQPGDIEALRDMHYAKPRLGSANSNERISYEFESRPPGYE